MTTLVLYRGDSLYRRIELEKRDLRIGRAAENDVVLEDAGKAVSRFHAELRYENNKYVLIDLNSQNGIYIDGRRVQREPLAAGSAAAIGPYRVVLEGSDGSSPVTADTQAPGDTPVPARLDVPTADTQVPAGGQRSTHAAIRPSDTLRPGDVRSGGPKRGGADVRVAAVSAPAAKPKRPPVKNTANQASDAPGFIGYLLRLPRPVLFGGFGAVMLGIIIAGQIFRSGKPTAGTPISTTTTPSVSTPTTTGPTNAQLIAGHLEAARAAMANNKPQDAIDRIEQILLIDSQHVEAQELKARAEDAIKRAAAGGDGPTPPPSGSETPATPPAGIPAAPAVPASVTAINGGGAALAGVNVPPGGRKPDTGRAGRGRASARDLELQALYDSARAAFERQEFAEAERLLESLIDQKSDFPDAASLLGQVRQGAATARQQAGAQALADARRLQDAGDWKAAFDAYQKAMTVDPGLKAAAENAQNQLRQRMLAAGEDAFKRARQYDARGRNPEALALYERALQNLPEQHPDRAMAVDRANALRNTIR